MKRYLPRKFSLLSLVTLCFMVPCAALADDPPYAGTVYIDPNWITPDDPSTFSAITPNGRQELWMFDRRVDDWTWIEARSFILTFTEGVTVIAQVNPEFSSSESESLAAKWGHALGQYPVGLIDKLGELHIQDGNELMGGNGRTDPTHVLIHEQHGDNQLSLGWAEEEVLHELGHAVFQPLQEDVAWIEAQNADPCFISDYARDYPDREDIAETLVPYLMMKFRPDRVSAGDSEAISKCIGARSQVLDSWFAGMGLSYYPWAAAESEAELRVSLEEPVNGAIHMGVGNLRGWAVSSEDITRVEILVDGVSQFDAPYGGNRTDVGDAFPDIPNSSKSGFSLAFNYSGLTAGQHTVTAIAHTTGGQTLESSATFQVVRFDEEFIPGDDAVDLTDSGLSAAGNEITITDVIVDGAVHDLILKWRPAEQGFEIIEIR